MNAPEKFLTAHLGAAEVRVPERLAIAAYLEQQLDLERPLSVGLATTVEEIRLPRRSLPTIGEVWDKEGLYAGVTLHNDELHALILLEGDMDDGTWEKAKAWAASIGGELPSRHDGLVLFKNMKAHFKPEYYWLNEQPADAAGYAWYQYFHWGTQSDCYVSLKIRARAVRRVPL